MLRELSIPALATMTVAVAACGGGGNTTAASGAHAASGTLALSRSRPTRIYTTALSGRAETTHGAPLGRGVAIIAFHGQSVVCWRFAHLHGFTNATVAHIFAGASGKAGAPVLGLSSGPRLHHEGCVSISPTVTRTIWSHPHAYYVSIASAQYPRGAVRAQL
jgi:CHRD domain